MYKQVIVTGFVLLALASGQLNAQSLPPAPAIPSGGVSALVKDWPSEMVRNWKGSAEFGSIQPTQTGLKLTTLQKPEFIYSLQAQSLNQIAISAGDTMLIRFAARSLKAEKATGATRLTVALGKASPPWTRAHRSELGLTSEWQHFDIPFKCPVAFDVKEAQFTFTFGYTPQEVEVANVSLLKFSPDVALSALPKTKRFANPVAPELLGREFARIAAMRKELDAIKDASPANGKTIHVSPAGSAQGTGEAAKPLATIPQALKLAEPGDTVLVAAGEYREAKGIDVTKSGRPDAWIKIKAAPGKRPKIITSNWSGIALAYGIAYIEIDGLELEWMKDPSIEAHGSGIAPMYATHHIRILNNVVHGYGTGGIITLDCDYIHIEGNVIYNTAHTSPYGGSGISLCRAFNFDEYPGYHNVVRRNVCYDNENKVVVLVESGGTGHTLTDGNGIIIDVFKRSRKDPLKNHQADRNGPLEPYRGRTLIENNICFNNGGRGVHIFRTEKVDVINNTCYMNQRTSDINAGEFTAIESSDVVIANNIGFSRSPKRVSGQDGSTGFVIWSHNLLFGDDALRHKTGIFDSDPLFVDATTESNPNGFALKPGSPALGKGLSLIAPRDDFAGHPRPSGMPVDLGAFQMSK